MIQHAQIGGPKLSWTVQRPASTAITVSSGQTFTYADIGAIDIERQYHPDHTPLRSVVWVYPCEPGYVGRAVGIRFDDARSIVAVQPDGSETRWQADDIGMLWRAE